MKILLATDGSDFSRAAVEKLCRMLVKPPNGGAIKIISVYEQLAPLAVEPFAGSAAYYAELEIESRRQAEQIADGAAAQIRECLAADAGDGAAKVEISTEVGMGAPYRLIVEAAKKWDADLIVVGSHGRGFWERTLLGSTSDGVIHHAPCSVLVVRQARPASPIDGGELARRAN